MEMRGITVPQTMYTWEIHENFGTLTPRQSNNSIYASMHWIANLYNTIIWLSTSLLLIKLNNLIEMNYIFFSVNVRKKVLSNS